MSKGSARIRKKKEKQRQSKILSKKYTPKEQKNLDADKRASEVKRIQANEKRRESRTATKNKLLKSGLSEKFVNKYRLYDKKFNKYTTTDLRNFKKADTLERHGITEYTKSDLRLSWERLANKFGFESPTSKKKILDNTLYVGVAEVQGSFSPESTEGVSSTQLVHLIETRFNEAVDAPNDSGSSFCVFIIRDGESDDMDYIANTFYSRAQTGNGYSKVTVSNKWDKHDFLSMVYNVLNHSKNEDAIAEFYRFRSYCRKHNINWLDGVKKN